MSTGAKLMSKPEPITEDTYKWHDEWNLNPQGFSTNVDDRFFGNDSPNKPPVFDVDVKLAADVVISDDIELASEVAQYWFPEDSERFTQVAIIVFNDASVWHIPLAPSNKDYERTRQTIVDRYIPDVVQWKAILNGNDPAEALEQLKGEIESTEEKWVKELDQTDMSEEQRQWFNDNARWLDHIGRTVESSQDDVDLNVNGEEQWTDDW
jgi:hypothetical protein